MAVEERVLASNAQALVQLEDAPVANGRAVDELCVIPGQIGLQECHPVDAGAAECRGWAAHAQGAGGRPPEPVSAHIIALITRRDLLHHEAIRERALLCEVLCYVSFDSNSIDPDRWNIGHVGAGYEDRAEFPGVEAAGFEDAVPAAVLHTV